MLQLLVSPKMVRQVDNCCRSPLANIPFCSAQSYSNVSRKQIKKEKKKKVGFCSALTCPNLDNFIQAKCLSIIINSDHTQWSQRTVHHNLDQSHRALLNCCSDT